MALLAGCSRCRISKNTSCERHWHVQTDVTGFGRYQLPGSRRIHELAVVDVSLLQQEVAHCDKCEQVAADVRYLSNT